MVRAPGRPRPHPADAAATAEALTEHPDFDWSTRTASARCWARWPATPPGFHHPSGRAYELLADWLIRLDRSNPQTTARMAGAFETWRRYDADRQQMMLAALERIRDTQGLSRDTTEMVTRILKQ